MGISEERKMNINIFEDTYFDNLQEKIQKRIEGKEIFVGTAYLFQNTIPNKEDLILWGIHLKESTSQELEEIYFQHLLETNTLIRQYPIMFSDLEMPEEIVTELSLPRMKVSSMAYILYENIWNKFYLHGNSVSCDVKTTNFICRGNIREATYCEVQDYLKTFSQKKNYLALLEMLLVSLQSCQFEEDHLTPPYLSSDLIPYYQKMDLNEMKKILNEELHYHPVHDFTKEKFKSEQLVRKLRK